MFKLIIITIVLIISLLIIYYYHKPKKELFISEEIVKYPLNESVESLSAKLSTISTGSIFYTKIPWKAKSNNYILHLKKYYIIEPGYYYYINKNCSINIGKDINIKLVKKNTGSF
jgi:hypothetical protein